MLCSFLIRFQVDANNANIITRSNKAWLDFKSFLVSIHCFYCSISIRKRGSKTVPQFGAVWDHLKLNFESQTQKNMRKFIKFLTCNADWKQSAALSNSDDKLNKTPNASWISWSTMLAAAFCWTAFKNNVWVSSKSKRSIKELAASLVWPFSSVIIVGGIRVEYLGLLFIHFTNIFRAWFCRDSFVKEIARAIKAFMLSGLNSRHFFKAAMAFGSFSFSAWDIPSNSQISGFSGSLQEWTINNYFYLKRKIHLLLNSRLKT